MGHTPRHTFPPISTPSDATSPRPRGHWSRVGRAVGRVLCAASAFGASVVACVGGGAIVLAPQPAYADGPIACGPKTQPPFPDEGFCADYDGDSTWYGTYGPGFPTPEGYGLC